MTKTVKESVYIDKYFSLLNEIKEVTNPERINRIEINKTLSDKQKEILINQTYKTIRHSLKFLRTVFDDISSVISKECLNIKCSDGKNLAALLAYGISTCKNEKVVEKYYKTFEFVVERGIDTNIKDNKGLTAADYLYWAEPTPKRDAVLSTIGRDDIVANARTK